MVESYCYRLSMTLSKSLFSIGHSILSCKFSFFMIILCSEKGVWKFWKLQMRGCWERPKKQRKKSSVPKRNVAQIVLVPLTKTKMWSHDRHKKCLAQHQWGKSGVWRSHEFHNWYKKNLFWWEVMVFIVVDTVLDRKKNWTLPSVSYISWR